MFHVNASSETRTTKQAYLLNNLNLNNYPYSYELDSTFTEIVNL